MKQNRPFSPGHRLPNRIVRQIPQPSPLSFHFFPFLSELIYRSLGVASEPSQERLPCFRESQNGESPGCSQESLSFSAQVTWCLSCMVLRGHISLLDATVGTVAHFCAISSTEMSLRQKEMAFCQSVTLSTPILWHIGKGWALIYLRRLSQTHSLATFSETRKFWPCQRPGPSTNWGTQKTWPLNGTLAFAKSRARTQNFFTSCPSWPSVRIRVSGTHATCLSVASLSPVPLCLSPSDFPDDPYLTFHIHMKKNSRKEFWGSLWSRSFSYFQKPVGSKNSPNILKNSLITTPVSQGGEGPSFPHSCKFP